MPSTMMTTNNIGPVACHGLLMENRNRKPKPVVFDAIDKSNERPDFPHVIWKAKAIEIDAQITKPKTWHTRELIATSNL
jgi:hypothetical protein